MKKRKKSILTFVLILIILALVNHIIYNEYYKPKQTSKKSSKSNITEKKEINKKDFVSKTDSSKDYIYDGNYIGDFTSESYTTSSGKTYHSKDLKAPYFNIDSSDATNANKEVNETYLNAVRIFDQGVSDKSTYIKLDYKKYENDDIISAIFKYEVGDIGITNPIYYTYNFDKETGNIITFKKAYEFAGIKEENIDDKVKTAIKKEIKKQMGENKDAYPEGETLDTYIDKTYSGYEDNKKYDLLKYILDSKNKLSIVVDLRIPTETEHLNTVIEIK